MIHSATKATATMNYFHYLSDKKEEIYAADLSLAAINDPSCSVILLLSSPLLKHDASGRPERRSGELGLVSHLSGEER